MFDVSFKMTVIITTHDRFRRRVVSQEHTLKIKSREKRMHFMVAHDEHKKITENSNVVQQRKRATIFMQAIQSATERIIKIKSNP